MGGQKEREKERKSPEGEEKGTWEKRGRVKGNVGGQKERERGERERGRKEEEGKEILENIRRRKGTWEERR